MSEITDITPEPQQGDGQSHLIPVSGLFENWFLDYASYVILERAVPSIVDGLKPVQRRILHTMYTMDDGRYNKVANIVGAAMAYHPHGDAAIKDAMVGLGQKELLIDCQGNWGDIRTGDSAAAARYIEARLTKFALEVAFNPDTTEWQLSYDGRKKEPVNLPMKFPLLLAQGAEGIAVGLSTKIIPHNFCELIEASIAVLQNKPFELYPDFPTGGLVDVSQYNEGGRGGKVRVRARIDVVDKKTIAIREIPFSTTTTSLIDSIIKANDKGKIKIKKVTDNTAQEVEIFIELQPNVSSSVAVDALYAFTDCEVSISPNACVIVENKPLFTGVNEMLRISTRNTLELLKQELEIKLADLESKWHFSSLEKIFIENRIYRDIEECETWEAVIAAIDKGLEPFKKLFFREITEDDITRLTEIKIKRISKFDGFKANEAIKQLEADMEQVKYDLAHLTKFAINYFRKLLEKYGKGRERKTIIANFDTVEVRQVAAANEKLYVNRKEGFVGFGKDMRKDEFVCECSDIDDIIIFRRDGVFKVLTAPEKAFVGKDIIHLSVWKKGDERTVYNTIYRDGNSGKTYAKRFAVTSITREKEYNVTKGSPRSQVLYFSANPNGEAELVSINLSPASKARIKVLPFNFAELDIKGRDAQGNMVTKYPVNKVTLKEEGTSTLGGMDIWLDDDVGRLNTERRGRYIGSFSGEDKILVLFKSGEYLLSLPDLSLRINMQELQSITKYNDPDIVISAIHYVDSKKCYYVKRFRIETTTLGQRYPFISEEPGSSMLFVTLSPEPEVEYVFPSGKSGELKTAQVNLVEFVDVKGWKALGNKLIGGKIISITELAKESPAAGEDDSEEVSTVEEATADIVPEGEISVDAEPPKPKFDVDFEITNFTEGEQGSLF
jgi:topoisomerase IV subunit A